MSYLSLPFLYAHGGGASGLGGGTFRQSRWINWERRKAHLRNDPLFSGSQLQLIRALKFSHHLLWSLFPLSSCPLQLLFFSFVSISPSLLCFSSVPLALFFPFPPCFFPEFALLCFLIYPALLPLAHFLLLLAQFPSYPSLHRIKIKRRGNSWNRVEEKSVVIGIILLMASHICEEHSPDSPLSRLRHLTTWLGHRQSLLMTTCMGFSVSNTIEEFYPLSRDSASLLSYLWCLFREIRWESVCGQFIAYVIQYLQLSSEGKIGKYGIIGFIVLRFSCITSCCVMVTIILE